jgi:hypothetical protein
MGRTLSLLGMVFFTVGVVALSSLARRAPYTPPLATGDGWGNRLSQPPRRAIPVFAYDAPFSLN